MSDKPQSRFAASVSSYGGLQGAGNRDYCAAAMQGVSKWNPCCLAGGLLMGVASVFTLVTDRHVQLLV